MVDAHSLTQLGLTAYEAAAYLALLPRARLAPAELAARAKIPRQRVYDVLDSLAAKGLCVETGAGRKSFAAVEPETALESLAAETAATLERQKREVADLAEKLAAQLAPAFAAGRSQDDPLAYVEVLAGTARIARRAVDLARRAMRHVNSCIQRPMILSDEQNALFISDPLVRGLRYRSLVDAEMMRDKAVRAWITPYRGQGMEVRVAPDLPLKMQSFDDEVVLVSMQDPAGGPPSFTAVVIHNRGAVAMLDLAFEHLWSKAKPFKG
jgi:hypothetical protein